MKILLPYCLRHIPDAEFKLSKRWCLTIPYGSSSALLVHCKTGLHKANIPNLYSKHFMRGMALFAHWKDHIIFK